MIVLLGIAGCGPKATVVPQRATSAQPPAVEDFSRRIQEYAALRDSVEKGLQPIPDQAAPAAIAARRAELAARIQRARQGVHEGNLFTPEVQPYFARIIATEMRGGEGKPARDAAKKGNPRYENEGSAGPVKIAVNAIYPEGAPVSVVPPTLLLRLPELPDELQYRFVGPDLVLVDSRSGLVVDVFRRAAPKLSATKR